MTLSKIAFLGTGKLAQALLTGLQSSPHSYTLSASVRSEASHAALQTRFPTVKTTRNNAELLENANLIILGVKPHAALELVGQIKDNIPQGAALVSLCARLPIQRLREILKDRPDVMILRLMPNTASGVGFGLLGISTEDGRAPYSEFLDFFARLGKTQLIQEDDMDTFTVLGACTPAYFLKMAEAFLQASVQGGLDRSFAQSSLAQVLVGAGKLLENTSLSSKDRIEQIATPGGVTAEGLALFDKKMLSEGAFAVFETALEKCRTLKL